jgi:hypothetical protein
MTRASRTFAAVGFISPTHALVPITLTRPQPPSPPPSSLQAEFDAILRETSLIEKFAELERMEAELKRAATDRAADKCVRAALCDQFLYALACVPGMLAAQLV